MSRTKKLTVSAAVTALCVICMAGSALLPRVSLSLAALAGIFPAITVIACGYGWAAGAFLAASLLALLLLPDKTAAVWFLCFFGHYPIWKALIEGLQARSGKPVLCRCLIILGFSACMALLYLAFHTLFSNAIPLDVSSIPAGPAVLIAGLLAAFLVYDYAFSIFIGFFRAKVLPKLR